MPGFWRKCRTVFRWMRFCVWALVLLALLALAWVNTVGFPSMVKNRLTAAMQANGVTLEFSRMRWRFIHGIVVENVTIGDKRGGAETPLFTAGQIQLRFDYGALMRRKFQITGVVVHDGIFTQPVSATNRLALLNLQAEVRFLPDETWALDELRADFSGAKIRLAGQVEHAPEMAKWDIFTGRKTAGQGALVEPLRNFSDSLTKIKFGRQPQISATLNGDARDVHSFTLRLNANLPAVTTPWFSAREMQFASSVTVPADAPVKVDASLDWWTNAVPFHIAWATRAGWLDLSNFDAHAVEFSGTWSAPRLAVTGFSGHFGGGKIDAAAALDVTTRELSFTNSSAFDPHAIKTFLPADARDWLKEILWTQPPSLTLAGLLTLPPWTNSTAGWRDMIPPVTRLRGELACTNAIVHGRTVELARTHFSYDNLMWSAPDLKLVQGRTRLEFSGEESAATENFRGALRGSIDAETIRPFLSTNLSAPLFTVVNLAEPVVLDLNASGNLHNLNSLVATGHVAVTNFAIREQAYESVTADATYTNRVLLFLHPQSFRAHGTQTMTADAVALDWNAHMYYFTNGFSTTDPMAVVRAIGPKTASLIEPYEFPVPPTARVNGQLPLRDLNGGRDLDGTDMQFEILHGTPFRWTKLSTTNIIGTVHWLGQELILTNIAADFYGGTGGGYAYFDFRPVGYGCDFNFGFTATNVDVHLLGADLSTSRSNLIEGRLTARATVTSANSKSWRSWNGYGDAQLRDGLLWNIQIFGFASPVLNGFKPGLGNSRATGASVKFVMTNGVARSDSLEILTRTMRLQYAGTVDLEQNANARVTAQLLRNTPVIGSIMSTVLWPVSKIFEFQVSGPISDPKVTPIFIPKYLLLPLHPIRTFEEMMPSADDPKG